MILIGEAILERRRFAGAVDLVAMQAIVAERTRVMGPCTNLHPGDIAHRIYSGLRGRDLFALVPVWDIDGAIAAFGIVWPDDHSFDVVMRVGLAAGIGMDVVIELTGLASGVGDVHAGVGTDVIGPDTELAALLTELGFTRGPDEYVATEARLDGLAPAEPDGFTIRSVTYADTEQLAAAHSGAFGGGWSATDYANRMTQPGYDPHNEIVAVDVSGRFMGFAIMWYDDMNGVGHFEPVGVHRDFQRRGVGSALLREGTERMRRAGMATATVWHAADDERTAGFYRSNGFVAVSPVTRWAHS